MSRLERWILVAIGVVVVGLILVEIRDTFRYTLVCAGTTERGAFCYVLDRSTGAVSSVP